MSDDWQRGVIFPLHKQAGKPNASGIEGLVFF